MLYLLDGEDYSVEIVKKGNKNTYIRIKEDLTIQVTTNFFASKHDIKVLLDKNQSFLRNTINKRLTQMEKNETFRFLGSAYDIIESNAFSTITFVENKIYVPSISVLNKWLKKEILRIFMERLDYVYNLFDEKIPYPTLKIRTMKTRWGVCNRRDNSVTLNSNLIKESIDKLDYVIVHELSHFIVFNHSTSFWAVVSKYCPKFKNIRKELRE